MKPQTIQIFHQDESPRSIRDAEITNRLLKAILFFRIKIQEVAKGDMVHFTRAISYLDLINLKI